MLQREMGERDGSALAAILLGEKSGMDQEMKELYQVNGIGHILAIPDFIYRLRDLEYTG